MCEKNVNVYSTVTKTENLLSHNSKIIGDMILCLCSKSVFRGVEFMACQVSVIGSFRKQNGEVVRIVSVLRKMGLNVASPKGSNVCHSIEEFGKMVLKNEQKVYMELEMCTQAQKARSNIFMLNSGDNKSLIEKKKIVICGSMVFYDEMLACQEVLRKNGIRAIIPKEEKETINL